MNKIFIQKIFFLNFVKFKKMSTQESKITRLSSIEKIVEELRTTREEKHKTIENSLEKCKKEREAFFNKISEQIDGLKRTI